MAGFNECLRIVLPTTGLVAVCVVALLVLALLSLTLVYLVERNQPAVARALLAEARNRTDVAIKRLRRATRGRRWSAGWWWRLGKLTLELWREYRAFKYLTRIGWLDVQVLRIFAWLLVLLLASAELPILCCRVWTLSRVFDLFDALLSRILPPTTLITWWER